MPLKHNLMTTLRGLMTISELFAGFNLINTGVVNCLIMWQNARKMHPSEAQKIQKNFCGRAQHLPRPFPIGEGDTPSPNPTPLGAWAAPLYSRLRRSTWPTAI